MNWWTDAVQYLIDALALLLVIRLLRSPSPKPSIFPAFCVFVLLQLAEGAFIVLCRHLFPALDYRPVWMIATAIIWIVSLALVYHLAKAVLFEHKGFLRFSRIFLNTVFPLMIFGMLFTVRREYWMIGGGRYRDAISRILAFWYVLDRAIYMSALLILVIILAFILWFPVKMPRNVAIFSVGFVAYFACLTALDLIQTYTDPGFQTSILDWINLCGNTAVALCFLYWLLFLDLKAEPKEVRMGHSWSPIQPKLIEQLEAMNLALLRKSQRL